MIEFIDSHLFSNSTWIDQFEKLEFFDHIPVILLVKLTQFNWARKCLVITDDHRRISVPFRSLELAKQSICFEWVHLYRDGSSINRRRCYMQRCYWLYHCPVEQYARSQSTVRMDSLRMQIFTLQFSWNPAICSSYKQSWRSTFYYSPLSLTTLRLVHGCTRINQL